MHIITTRLITSSDALKRRKGEGGLALDLRPIRVKYQHQPSTATLGWQHPLAFRSPALLAPYPVDTWQQLQHRATNI